MCRCSRLGVGVTKAPFVNFSANKTFDFVKLPVKFFESLSYLIGVTALAAMTHAKYKRDTQQLTCILTMMKYEENNGTEEIGSVTPPPDVKGKHGLQ